MNTEKIGAYKKDLEHELAELETELASVGRVNPDNPADWEPRPADADILASDPNELGDKFDQYEENTAILKPLETRYNEIKRALEKIKSGEGFGICEVCGKEIESDRLGADPAAPTCKTHMK